MNHSISQEADATVFRVSGELDALSSHDIRPDLEVLASRASGAVVVDLSELRVIDSSGVGALVSLYKRVRANGGAVRFVGVKAQPLVIFKLLRLDRAFQLA